jgi:hypothetical protein
MNLLTLDIGGARVKLCTKQRPEVVSGASRPKMAPTPSR